MRSFPTKSHVVSSPGHEATVPWAPQVSPILVQPASLTWVLGEPGSVWVLRCLTEPCRVHLCLWITAVSSEEDVTGLDGEMTGSETARCH